MNAGSDYPYGMFRNESPSSPDVLCGMRRSLGETPPSDETASAEARLYGESACDSLFDLDAEAEEE